LLSLALLICFIFILNVSMNTEFHYQREGKDTWEQLILGDPLLDWDLDDSDDSPIGLDGEWDIYDLDQMTTIVNRTVRVYYASKTAVDKFDLPSPYVRLEFEHDAPFKGDNVQTGMNRYEGLGYWYGNDGRLGENGYNNSTKRYNSGVLSTLSNVFDPFSSNTKEIDNKIVQQHRAIFNGNNDKSLFKLRPNRLQYIFNPLKQPKHSKHSKHSTTSNSTIAPSQKTSLPLPSEQFVAFNTHQTALKSRSKNTALKQRHKSSALLLSNPQNTQLSTEKNHNSVLNSKILKQTVKNQNMSKHYPHRQPLSNIPQTQSARILSISGEKPPVTEFNITALDLGPFQTARDDPDTLIDFIQDTHVSKITLSYQLRHYTFRDDTRACMEWM